MPCRLTSTAQVSGYLFMVAARLDVRFSSLHYVSVAVGFLAMRMLSSCLPTLCRTIAKERDLLCGVLDDRNPQPVEKSQVSYTPALRDALDLLNLLDLKHPSILIPLPPPVVLH